jgi:pilus assembly protein CpaF
MTTEREESDGRVYAHEAFVPSTDQAAERMLWRGISEDLARRFDAAALLKPGAATQDEIGAIVSEHVARFRRAAAMRNTRGLDDPDGVARRLLDRLQGPGFLAPFLAADDVEEVSVNGSRLYVTRAGRKQLVEEVVPDEAETLQLIKRIIGPLGARLDESQPVVECGLSDGSRLTAVIPPMSNTVQLTIRRYVLPTERLETLVGLGTLTQDPADFLDAAVRAGVNIVVCGPTAAGKTTLVNALGAAIPAAERVVTIEDLPELNLKHPDWVPLFARIGNVEGVGAITYRTLMRTALRLRPTYLLVGEVRGAECLDMLAAMSTGHASMSTVHGRSPRGALKQLATFAQMAEEHVSRKAITDMIAATVELVIVLRIDPLGSGRRQVVHIFEVTGLGQGSIVDGHDLWTVPPPESNAAGCLQWTGIRPRCLEKMMERGVDYELPPLALQRARNPNGFAEDGG